MAIYLTISVIGLVLLIASFIFDDVIGGVLDSGPEWLTGISIGAFLTVAGVTGVFFTNTGASPLVTALAAVAAAVVIGLIVNWIARATMGSNKQQGAINETNLIGLEGTSVLGAAAGSSGEVMLSVNGHPHKVNGRCADALAAGDRVRVTSATSITSVTVEKLT